MRLPCKGKSIDLSKLSESIEEFFKSQDYQVVRIEITDGYGLRARPISHLDHRPHVLVIIKGHPDKFTIDFSPIKSKSDSRMGDSVTSLLFGGRRTKKRYERLDEEIAFERKFWSHVTKAISALKGSSRQ